jgi:hypothetical protein
MIDQQVTRLMDAYRGNPGALAQNAGVPPDLIKLLALQQLKSEKEAAMRSMQMAAAPQTNQMPTVADQREQELLDMTTQQIAQQVGGVAQQKQQSEKQNLQKLLQSGIASASGAQSAAQPQMMAAGGIVAFAEGDPVEDPVVKRMQELLRRGASVETLRRNFRNLSVPEFHAALEAAQRAPVSPISGPETPAPRAARPMFSTTGFPESSAVAGPPESVPEADYGAGTASRQSVAVSPPPAPSPAEPAAPAAPAFPIPTSPGGMDPELRKALEQTITKGLTPQPNQLQIDAETQARRLAATDPMAVAEQFRAEFPQLTKAELDQQQARLARRRAMLEEQYNPKQQGIEQLLRMGAAFSRGLTPGMAAGPSAEVGLNYMAQQRAARAKAEDAILTEEERQMESALTGRREGYKGGVEGYKAAMPGQMAGSRGLADLANARRLGDASALEAASRMLGTESAVAANRYSAELQAAVSAANNAATVAERELARGPAETSNLLGHQARLTAAIAETERKFREDKDKYLTTPGAGLRIANALRDPTKPENRRIVDDYKRQVDQELAALTGPAKALLAQVNTALNRTIPGGAPGGAPGGGAVSFQAEVASQAQRALRERLGQGAGGR